MSKVKIIEVLRIEDKVDLRELEKFGFEKYGVEKTTGSFERYQYNGNEFYLTVYVSDRELELYVKNFKATGIETKLFELFQANLFEKVKKTIDNEADNE